MFFIYCFFKLCTARFHINHWLVDYPLLMKKLAEVESRTQGSRPRTQKNPRPRRALPRTDPLKGQGQECSRPRTKDGSASVLKKKSSSKKFFRRSPVKNVFQNFFSGDVQTFNYSKKSAVQFSRT